MKKLVFTILLVLAVLPSFAQEDEYARFQGVWRGKRKILSTIFTKFSQI
jgi:hypothetical protein